MVVDHQETNCISKAATPYPGTDRVAAASISYGVFGYFGTGWIPGTSSFFNDFWRYDYHNDSWTQLPNFPGAVTHDPVTFEINGKILIGLGCNSNSLWSFDPQSNTWSQMADFPSAIRYNSAYFSIGDKGYVICGYSCTGGTTFDEVWEYNSLNNTWTQLANFPEVLSEVLWVNHLTDMDMFLVVTTLMEIQSIKFGI